MTRRRIESRHAHTKKLIYGSSPSKEPEESVARLSRYSRYSRRYVFTTTSCCVKEPWRAGASQEAFTVASSRAPRSLAPSVVVYFGGTRCLSTEDPGARSTNCSNVMIVSIFLSCRRLCAVRFSPATSCGTLIYIGTPCWMTVGWSEGGGCSLKKCCRRRTLRPCMRGAQKPTAVLEAEYLLPQESHSEHIMFSDSSFP